MNKLNIFLCLKMIAKNQNGVLLSSKYKNMHTKLKWRCKKRHIWFATGASIKYHKSWCPDCSGSKKKSIEEIQNQVKKFGGTLLTRVYKNGSTKLSVICKNEHRFKTSWRLLRRGNWCTKCSGLKKKTISEMRAIAKAKGGKCLSKVYKNAHSPLDWTCGYGHSFRKNYNSIQQGSWCLYCHGSYGEEYFRSFISKTTGRDFHRIRLRAMASKKGFPLEFDGYCEELGIAFEHQGPHHFGEVAFSRKHKYKQISNDNLKKDFAKKNNIVLIEVPWIPKKLKESEVGIFLHRLALKLPRLRDAIKVDPRDIDIDPSEMAGYRNEAFTKIAEKEISEKGGKLISKFVSSVTMRITVKCEFGHVFNTNLNKIRNNRWCQTCRCPKQISISDCQLIAAHRGGKCLSKIYINNHSKLKWECKNNHIWFATYNHIKQGRTWCSTCSRKKKHNIEVFHKIAKSRGGKVLSKRYINLKSPLTFQCIRKHIWTAIGNNIKNHNSWCPYCRNPRPIRK